jgi:hypothetical protein
MNTFCKIIFLITFSFFSILNSLYAQKVYTVSGTVKDKLTNEPIIGVVVSAPSAQTGTLSDENGFYSLSIPFDTITIVVEQLGYKKEVIVINLGQDMTIDFLLAGDEEHLKEIVIEGNPHKEAINSTQMSKITLSAKDAKQVPVIFGETDLIKIFQLKPGVQSGGEGTSGLYVRGGGPDQNLFLVDNAIVYNPNHLFGLFSIFNTDAVKSIDLYKGDFPAQFGGRLSSVVDVKLNEGSDTKTSVRGGIGLIASRLTVDGPIKKNKASYIISARRTYFDVFTSQYNRMNKNNASYDPIPAYYFYDVNGKVNYTLNEKNSFYLTGYFGRDIFKYNQNNLDFTFNWGNSVGVAGWNHTFSDRLKMTTSIVYSEYRYNIKNRFKDFSFKLSSLIRDYTLQSDFKYQHSEKHSIKFGLYTSVHRYIVGRLRAGTDDGTVQLGLGSIFDSQEAAVYASDDFEIGARWKFNTGLRLSAFRNKSNLFGGIEPRVSFRYLISEKVSWKGSFARMYQYIHLISNSGASLPTDIWYPSNSTVKPQRSDQVATGFSLMLGNNYFLTDEVYYKWMKRQIDFKDGAMIYSNPNLDQEFVFGKGWAYGNEIYLEKRTGKTTGWVGYTLSWTWKQFPYINDGEKFFARYDRRHDVSIVVVHRLNERLNFSGTWVYGTGNAVSLPNGRFILQDIEGTNPKVIPVYSKRNGFRMPPYHRMDLGLIYKFIPKKEGRESDLTLSIYNVYNRKNAYFIYFDEIQNEFGVTTRFQAKQVSLFPIIPSLTYNFKF